MKDWNSSGFDSLIPAEMARKAEELGVAKAGLSATTMIVLGVLAGAFIALGAVLSTVAVSGAASVLPFGLTRLVAGLTFSLGLILVVVAGAELFTGNNLIVMAWAGRRVSTGALIRNWTLVYAANFVGAIGTAALVFATGHHQLGGGQVGQMALQIAAAKCQLDPVEAVARGILCNALVCLAVWLSFSARTTTDRILAVVPPVTAFVACGFEHSIANMYFVPFALMIDPGTETLASLTWSNFVFANLLPVTVGNIVGGSGLVGLIYWFVYLRGDAAGR